MTVTTWRWRCFEPLPPLNEAFVVADAARAALFARLPVELGGRTHAAFHGPTSETEDHSHAFYLPEDADHDGIIDHIVVHADVGLPREIIAALASVECVQWPEGRLRVEPDWMGRRGEGGLFGPAVAWTAQTPFITPRWRLNKQGKARAKYEPEAQLRAEIAARELPEPTAIDWSTMRWIGPELATANVFAHRLEYDRAPRTRAPRRAPPADAVASFPSVVFPEPVWGPLAFGYGAHFGLGLLAPAMVDGAPYRRA